MCVLTFYTYKGKKKDIFVKTKSFLQQEKQKQES